MLLGSMSQTFPSWAADESPMRGLIRRVGALVAFGVLLLAGAPSHAEKNDAGGWITAAATGSFEKLVGSDRFLWWLDAQVRLYDDLDGYGQSLVRPGLGYDLGKGFSTWLGYAYVDTNPRSHSNFEEHRIWQQLLWARPVGDFGLQSRTRLEERYVDGDGETGWRLRQFFRGSYALPFAPRFGLVGSEELFFDLNDTDWGADRGFTQNRFSVALSARLNEKGSAVAELGYLNQYIRRDGARDAVNHLVVVSLMFNLR
jgi:hypothetical protein